MNMIPITDQQFDALEEYLIYKYVRSRQVLLSPGEVSNHSFFVMKGCLRSYIIFKDTEDIIQFAPETRFIGSAGVSPDQSTLYIDAVEDSKVAMINYDFFRKLEEMVPESIEMRQKLRLKEMRSLENRIIHLMSSTAEERYKLFLSEYNNLIHRLPQHMIAAYLGIRPQSLSRVRASLNHPEHN